MKWKRIIKMNKYPTVFSFFFFSVYIKLSEIHCDLNEILLILYLYFRWRIYWKMINGIEWNRMDWDEQFVSLKTIRINHFLANIVIRFGTNAKTTRPHMWITLAESKSPRIDGELAHWHIGKTDLSKDLSNNWCPLFFLYVFNLL